MDTLSEVFMKPLYLQRVKISNETSSQLDLIGICVYALQRCVAYHLSYAKIKNAISISSGPRIYK